jgi:superoxide dismutase, Cu-Zn family
MVEALRLAALVAASTLALAGCAIPGRGGHPPDALPRTAVAMIEPRSGSTAEGVATFTETEDGVRLVVQMAGMEPGLRAMHIHEYGDCSAPDASSAGGHWNPDFHTHGAIHQTDRAHRGDIGNIEIGPDGRGRLEITTRLWTLGGDAMTSVVGRSIVVHAGADDLRAQPDGGAGIKVGCGVIQFPRR